MKDFLKLLDRMLSGGVAMKVLAIRRRRRFHNETGAPFDATMTVGYTRGGFSSEMGGLCDLYGSDKGEAASIAQPYPWPSHLYTDLYELLFGQARASTRLVVECGIGTNNPNLVSSMGIAGRPGASLRVWRDYFPYARVIGVDIDSDILFRDERIETFQCDQTSALSIAGFRRAAGLEDGTVDLVIDDGLHEYQAGVAFFEGMWPALRVGGTHVIEDIVPPDAPKFADYLANLPVGSSGMLFDMTSGTSPIGYNTLAVIRKSAT
jgi:hypothetical protein